MSATSEQEQRSCLPSGVVILGLVAVGILISYLIQGWDYYMLAPSQRPFHPEHEVLRPSGRMGLVWGITSAVLIVLNLGYLLRRQLVRWHWLGSLRVWLGLHMMTGLIAAVAAMLHSTLTVSSPLAALAFWCLQLLAVTGLSGIILYHRLSFSVESRDIECVDPSPSLRRLLQTWRFFHRWLAILLIVVVALHIFVAIRFGDLWLLRGRP